MADKDEVKQIFQYPLLQAIAHRRTRRFPLGCSMETGVLEYKSQNLPVPLNRLETAILCWAGTGITGTIVSDEGQTAARTWLGRTTPYPCNIQNAKLFFTNDNGVFLYDPKQGFKVVEIETDADHEKIIRYFDENTIKLSDKRLEVIPQAIQTTAHWYINKPGTTMFMPIVDLSPLYINLLLDIFQGEGYQLMDDTTRQPAGIKQWIDSGRIRGPRVRMSSYENNVFVNAIAPAYLIAENMSLVAEAIGLGWCTFAGYTAIVMLGGTPLTSGLGFRFVEAKDGRRNPVGLDGVFESYSPPYYKTMGDAVDAIVEQKFGPGGTFSADYRGAVPLKNWRNIAPTYKTPSKEVIDMVKAYCGYVYDTYGRFPATVDTIVMPIWQQAHHLEIEFYDKYMASELVNDSQRQHMSLWHK